MILPLGVQAYCCWSSWRVMNSQQKVSLCNSRGKTKNVIFGNCLILECRLKSLRSYVVESKITTSIFYVRKVREITKPLIHFVFFLKWAGFLRIEKELQTLSTILCRKQWKRSWKLIIFFFRRRDDFESL